LETYDLIMKIRAKTGLSQNDIRKSLEALQEIIHEEISAGRDVEIPNFGKYTVVSYAQTQTIEPVAVDTITEFNTNIVNEKLNLVDSIISKKTLNRIPKHIAHHFQVIPVEERDDVLVIAMADPEDAEAIEFLKKKINKNLEIRPCTQKELNYILKQYV